MATAKSTAASAHAQLPDSEDICERVGIRIRALRVARHWSQQLLADHAELSKVHIIAVEKGRAELGLRALDRISKALGVKVEDLIRGS